MSVRTAFLILMSITLMSWCPVVAIAQEADERELVIAEQALPDSLKFVADEFGLQLAFFSAVVEDFEAPALNGSYTQDQALEALLAETVLEYGYIDNGTVVVRTKDQGGNSDSGNASPAPILMAQNQTVPAQTTSNRSEEGGTSIVTGKVTDARTGANLKGAKVTIEETGQWTSTGGLGRFRFASVPNGSVTVTVSFLGYVGQSTVVGVRGDSVSQDFALRGGSEIEEIVVFGQRSGRAQALNLERTAENLITVISSDLLGQFPGTTVSEALRRAPGIAFVPDGITGEGVNIIVRGLAPDLNQVTLNGQRLAVGNGTDRSPALNNILTESISEVRINKTLLPSQDGNGTGGLVEIVTKGPLDRPSRFFQVGLEGTRSDSDFQEEFLASATASHRFGKNENFGLSASVQYRERDLQTVGYSLDSLSFGQYFPLDGDGDPITSLRSVDPRLSFPFEPGVDLVYPTRIDTFFRTNLIEDLSYTVSGQWQWGTHTDLRFDYNKAEQTQDRFSRDQRIGASVAYEPLPIAELGGEIRGALVVRTTDIGELQVRGDQNYLFEDGNTNTTDTFNFGGETVLDRWEFKYSAGFSKAENDRPSIGSLSAYRDDSLSGSPFSVITSIPSDLLTADALANTVDGRIVSIFAPRTGEGYPSPLFTSEGFAFFNEGNYQIPFGSIMSSGGSNERSSFNASVQYDFDPPWLDYVTAGVFFERSQSENLSFIQSNAFSTTGFNQSLQDLGISLGAENLSDVGLNSNFFVISESQLRSFFSRLDQLEADGLLAVSSFSIDDLDPRFRDVGTEEEELAAFVETKLRFGDLELIGGARIVRVDTSATVLNGPTFIDSFGNSNEEFATEFNEIIDLEGKQTDILPRVLANYRFSDKLILRGGYFATVARPSISFLNSDRSLSIDLRERYGPDGNQPRVFIEQGNVDLKPTETDNYDISLEYYTDDTVLKASAFYKVSDNIIFNNEFDDITSLDGIVLPDSPLLSDLPDNIFIQGAQPQNSPFDAEVWGLELVAETTFSNLPSVFSGLGVYANYTYTDSKLKKVVEFDGGEVIVTEPFEFQPNNSYTMAGTYSGFGIDASLSYTFQDRFQTNFVDNNLSFYREEYDTLDFRASYRTESTVGHWVFFIEGSDLLKGSEDATVSRSRGGEGGTPRVFTGGTFLGGRTVSLGVSATFY